MPVSIEKIECVSGISFPALLSAFDPDNLRGTLLGVEARNLLQATGT